MGGTSFLFGFVDQNRAILVSRDVGWYDLLTKAYRQIAPSNTYRELVKVLRATRSLKKTNLVL